MSGAGSPVLWPVTAPRDPERSTQPRAAAWASVRKPPPNRLANASLTKAHGPSGGPVVGLAERSAGHKRDAQDAQVILRDVAPVDGREYERHYCQSYNGTPKPPLR